MSESVYFTTLALVLGTVLLVFGLRTYAKLQQAKAQLGHDNAYRQVAVGAANAGSETAAALSSIQATLVDMKLRLAAVEKILKAVE